jgi:hypothetical protein
MKKTIAAILFAILFSTVSFAQYYELYENANNDPEKFYVEVTSLENAVQVPEGSRFVSRLNMKNAAPTKETKDNSVKKEPWAVTAEAVYTNCLETLGFSRAWSNMDWTFETVGTGIIGQMMEAAAAGNVEQMNLLSTYKGIVKDSYETLLKYALKYGIDDMRLYPYGSEWIFREIQEWEYLEYGGERYWNFNGPVKYVPEDNTVEPAVEESAEENSEPEEITYRWFIENRDYLENHAIMHCPKGPAGDRGII